MVQFLEKLFTKDRRRFPRHPVNGRFDLIVQSNEGTTISWTVDALDVSLGGAAFTYQGSAYDLANSGQINLYNGASAELGFKTVSDIEHSEGSPYRRRGVKFDWMGASGKKQLAKFIEEYGT